MHARVCASDAGGAAASGGSGVFVARWGRRMLKQKQQKEGLQQQQPADHRIYM